MAKKKQNNVPVTITTGADLQQNYIAELDTNPEFALVADPTGQLNMSKTTKDFILHYVNFKSVGTAADLTGITAEDAKALFVSYDVQQEIRRINRALYHRQFAAKLISIDELSGYLSSLLTNEYVPIAEQLKTTEKLRVVELLLRMNELKANGIANPEELNKRDIAVQIKNLSINTIEQLLLQVNTSKDKNKAIATLDNGQLSPEEKAYLQSLPLPELLQLIEETNKGGK